MSLDSEYSSVGGCIVQGDGDSQPLDIVARHRSERYFFAARSIVKNYFDHTAIVVVMVVAVL
jgi:hypothetical protein